jgi:hypothetical protein
MPRPPSVLTGVKCDTTKLCSEGSLASHKMNLLILVVQLIVLCRDFGSWMTSTGSDRPNKLADLNDGIRCQMAQLNSEFVHNVHKNQMRWHTDPRSEKVFEDNNFVHTGLRHRLRVRGSAISLGEIASVVLH